MTCQRCQGLMVSVTLEDSEGTVMCEPTLDWRCLVCGAVTDPTIAENRAAPLNPLTQKPTARFGVKVGETANRGRKHKRGWPRTRRNDTGYPPLVRR